MDWTTIFSSAVVLGFGWYASYSATIAPHTRKSSEFKSGEFGGHSSFLKKSGQNVLPQEVTTNYCWWSLNFVLFSKNAYNYPTDKAIDRKFGSFMSNYLP